MNLTKFINRKTGISTRLLTSSTMTCVTLLKSSPLLSRLSKTPVVQKRSFVLLVRLLSPRIT